MRLLVVVLLGLAGVQAGLIIPDQRLFVQQALVRGRRGARRPLECEHWRVARLQPCQPLCPLSGAPVTDLQESPRESFDFWVDRFSKVYSGAQVRARRAGATLQGPA